MDEMSKSIGGKRDTPAGGCGPLAGRSARRRRQLAVTEALIAVVEAWPGHLLDDARVVRAELMRLLSVDAGKQWAPWLDRVAAVGADVAMGEAWSEALIEHRERTAAVWGVTPQDFADGLAGYARDQREAQVPHSPWYA